MNESLAEAADNAEYAKENKVNSCVFLRVLCGLCEMSIAHTRKEFGQP